MIETDVKLFQAEKMNLTDDAGGRRSANVIPYGQENSIFPDISREARNRGKNLLMKVWVAGTTDNTEPYKDPVAIVSRIPDDEDVGLTIFATADETGDDKRPDARHYLEQSVVIGGQSSYYLYGLHNYGSGAITVWCRTEDDPPNINSTYILAEGGTEQSIRIIRILSKQIRVFSDSQSEFKRLIISLQISAPLTHTFHGSDVKRNDNSTEIVVRIYNSIVSDSTRIYGTTRLTETAEIGDLQVTVASLNARVIPSNISYLPSTDLNAAGEAIALQESGEVVTLTVTFALGAAVSLYLGMACMPGSLSITVASGTLTDDGGQLKSGTIVIGTVDYNGGIVLFASDAPTYGGTKTVHFTPAAPVQRVQNTYAIKIFAENRGKVYIADLLPPPAPGSLRVAYLSGGKWYTLRDKGNGVITAENIAYGTGQITYSTGASTVTLGALPDIYSSIIYFWATPADTFNRSNLTPSKLFFDLILDNIPANGTIAVSWGEVFLEDDGYSQLSGTGGTGIAYYGEKRLRIYPANLPQIGQAVTVNYEYGAATTYDETFTPIPGPGGEVDLTLAHGNVIAGSVLLKYPVKYKKYLSNPEAGYAPAPIPVGESVEVTGIIAARDNGVNGWINSNGAMSYGDGTLSYFATGTARAYQAVYQQHGWLVSGPIQWQISGSIQTTHPNLIPCYSFIEWSVITSPIELAMGTVTVNYRAIGTTTPASEEFTVSELTFDLTNDFAEPIVPRSVRFMLGAAVFADLNAGTLYLNPSAQTGAGTQAGTLDYQSGISTLMAWPAGAANTPTMQSLITRLVATTASTCSFRTAGAPIQSGQLSVRVVRPDGTVLTAQANLNGEIQATGIDGMVDFQVGMANLGFGTWIVATGHEDEPWYDAQAVRQDGKIFRPEPVLIDTLTYSAVTVRYLPIDAESLGVDPTRFPPDGLMPIFHLNDTSIIHHTLSLTLPNPLVGGSVIDCGRTHVTWITVVDTTGAAVPATGRFLLDSEPGTVTVANPIDLSGFTQPLTLYHTIADRSVVTDLDIAGIVTLSRTLRHNFPEGALVSSALQLRTLQADWDTVFSQQAWLNTWSDTRQGNPILAQYNYAQFPPVVTNHHATRQRYALLWKSATQFDAIGETMGYIGSGDKNTDFSPTNLLTGGPLLTLKALGQGALWVAGNVLRLNTTQVAEKSIWCLLSINPSDPGGSDKFEIRILGDINA